MKILRRIADNNWWTIRICFGFYTWIEHVNHSRSPVYATRVSVNSRSNKSETQILHKHLIVRCFISCYLRFLRLVCYRLCQYSSANVSSIFVCMLSMVHILKSCVFIANGYVKAGDIYTYIHMCIYLYVWAGLFVMLSKINALKG